MTATPDISVVIASGAGGEFLFRCLNGLAAQAEEEKAQVIVVDRMGGATAERIRREHPGVELVDATGGRRPSVPELRKLGVQRARGRIVAILEEHCVPPPDWLATLRTAFAPGTAAVGGPILDDRYRSLRDWVVYFSEYHNYLPPWPEGARLNLNGANVAYDRRLLEEFMDLLDTGYWEVVLHPRLAERGAFRSVPAMGVRHTGPFQYGYYLRQRYLLSRVWGGTQRSTAPAWKRLTYLLMAPLFPPLLLMRIGSRVFQSGRLRGRFLATVPLLVPVTSAYVTGEWLGYLLGPGKALEHVE